MEWDVTNSFQGIFHQPQWEYHGNSMAYGAGDNQYMIQGFPEMTRLSPMYGNFFRGENYCLNLGTTMPYPLVNIQKAIENCHL
jgi:hypothetical protein